MSRIKPMLEKPRADRAAGMPKPARFRGNTHAQLDATEEMPGAEAPGDTAIATVDERELEADLDQSIKDGLLGAVVSREESLRRVQLIAQTKLNALVTSSSVKELSTSLGDGDIDTHEACQRLKALAGSQDLRKVPRR